MVFYYDMTLRKMWTYTDMQIVLRKTHHFLLIIRIILNSLYHLYVIPVCQSITIAHTLYELPRRWLRHFTKACTLICKSVVLASQAADKSLYQCWEVGALVVEATTLRLSPTYKPIDIHQVRDRQLTALTRLSCKFRSVTNENLNASIKYTLFVSKQISNILLNLHKRVCVMGKSANLW